MNTARIKFNGVNITDDILPYLLSLSYTDNEEGSADDLQIKLHDVNEIWTKSWIQDIVQSASGSNMSDGFSVEAEIISDDKKLSCGKFTLDSVVSSGPPGVITIKASSLSFASTVKQTKKTKAWEKYYLSKIAKEIASNNNMACMFLADNDPYYSRVEQLRKSDIAFLSMLCSDAGMSLKATDGNIVIFSQENYESKDAVLEIQKGTGYISYNLSFASADTNYESAVVSYTDPSTGESISGTAKTEEKVITKPSGAQVVLKQYVADVKPAEMTITKPSGQTITVTAKVASKKDADAKAKAVLRKANKYESTVSFTIVGNVGIVAGQTVNLKGWGAWDGKYIITQSIHSIGSGYTTKITLRKTLEGY